MEIFSGKKLKRERIKRGLSFGEFALLLSVYEKKAAKGHVWSWESGKAKPNSRHLMAISKVLGIEPNYLFEGSGGAKKKA